MHSSLVCNAELLDSFLRIREVLSRVGVSRSTWLAWVRRGAAPEPVRLGPSAHIAVWRARDIQLWMDEQAAGRGSRITPEERCA